ncbi:hypothetical protein ACFLQL_01385 [Verrucomicrobiota bacterium]
MNKVTPRLCLDEASNVVDYLKRAATFLEQTLEDVTAWKWVVISLHGALYGAAVCNLYLMDRKEVLVKDTEKLIDFATVVRRCQDARFMNGLVTTNVLHLTPRQKRSIKFLNQPFRNSFVHFSPTSWAIVLRGFPDMVRDVVQAIIFLTLESGNHIMHLAKHRDELLACFHRIAETLEKHYPEEKRETRTT